MIATADLALFARLVETRLFGDRIYPRVIGDAVLPAVAYQLIASPDRERQTLTGPNALRKQGWQLDVYARTYTECRDLVLALAPWIDGIAGEWGGVEVTAAWIETEREMDAGSTGVHRRMVEVMIHYHQVALA